MKASTVTALLPGLFVFSPKDPKFKCSAVEIAFFLKFFYTRPTHSVRRIHLIQVFGATKHFLL